MSKLKLTAEQTKNMEEAGNRLYGNLNSQLGEWRVYLKTLVAGDEALMAEVDRIRLSGVRIEKNGDTSGGTTASAVYDMPDSLIAYASVDAVFKAALLGGGTIVEEGSAITPLASN